MSAVPNDADRVLVITRVFDAPPAAVFKAWIDPAQIVRWIGPQSIKGEVKAMEPRPGGAYRIALLHGASGPADVVSGVYHEVLAPQRLVFTWAWETPDGVRQHETLVTVTFHAKGKQTEMTLRQEIFQTRESCEKHRHGWQGSFDKVDEVLAGKPGRVLR
ncbi:MAG: SRPBCC domain-containing protein [Alphaproteobacteria bacterium]|nr:SRPBCC domain-containing protein [Alphaproteobacteria bacterium]